MNILIIGHSLVIDSNRKIWNELAKNENITVDLIVPKKWKSNLSSKISFNKNDSTDSLINKIFPLPCFLKGKGSYYFYCPLRLFKILNTKKYDVILLAQESWSLSLLELRLLLPLTSSRSAQFFLWICQNIKKTKLRFLHFFERFNCYLLKAILCCCHEAAEVIKWKKIEKPCLYFPFSYDEDNYQVTNLGQNHDDLVLGYMGRLSEEKGLLILLEAIEKLNGSGLNLKLKIAGEGPLKQKIVKTPFVSYQGLLKHQDAHNFYKNIDVFILPSQTRPFWKEQFGRVIIESVASGRPVIGSSSGAIPEVLGKIGLPYIFKEGDSNDLAYKIKQVRDDFLNQKIGSLMQESILKNKGLFSHQSVANNFLRYCKEEDYRGESL